MDKAFFSMRNIVKTYFMGGTPQTVLRGVDLTLQESEFVAVLGPSGSGSPRS